MSAAPAPSVPAGEWDGGPVGESAIAVRQDNPGPMTLDGTNTWLIGGGEDLVVVDPGEDDDAHQQRIVEVARQRGGRISHIVLTHSHLDHRGGAPRLAALTGAPVLGASPWGAPLLDGQVVGPAGAQVQVVTTPGHTADSICLLAPGGALLTGDTVLGRGTSVVARPDGDLGDYLASLETIRALIEGGGVDLLLPGHGPPIHAASAVIEYYLAHRAERLEQVRQARSAGIREVDEVVAAVYADVDRSLWPAAASSVAAQLAYLERVEASESDAAASQAGPAETRPEVSEPDAGDARRR